MVSLFCHHFSKKRGGICILYLYFADIDFYTSDYEYETIYIYRVSRLFQAKFANIFFFYIEIWKNIFALSDIGLTVITEGTNGKCMAACSSCDRAMVRQLSLSENCEIYHEKHLVCSTDIDFNSPSDTVPFIQRRKCTWYIYPVCFCFQPSSRLIN